MKKKKIAFQVCGILLSLFLLAVPVSAKTHRKRISEWFTTKANNTYFYNQKGERSKGLVKIGKYIYYFDDKGIQRTGWQKVNGKYYYFRIMERRKAYAVCSKTVNGVRLTKNGKAKVTRDNKEKLELMVRANQLMESLTNNRMTSEQKLRVAFDQARNNLKAYNRGGFNRRSDWDVFYAKIAFDTGRADCYSYAAYFAYLANAVGYKVSCVSSGGHGWAEIDGKVYDPNWSRVDKAHDYFGMPSSLSGVGGRPKYSSNRYFVITI